MVTRKGRRMTEFTHQKRSYKATVLVWDGANTRMVEEFLQKDGSTTEYVARHDGIFIMIRNPNHELRINTITLGTHIVLRENGTVKFYRTKEEFDIQYEPLPIEDVASYLRR